MGNCVSHHLLMLRGGVDAVDSDGLTAFARACTAKNIGAMSQLLEAGADPRQIFKRHDVYVLNATSAGWREETTAALLACALGNAEMLDLLFRFGVSANDRFLGRALLVACRCRDKAVVALLLQHDAEVDAIDATGMSALHAIRGRYTTDPEAVRLLLEAGATVNLRDHEDRTPLHVACEWEQNDVAWMLLNAGADVNAACSTGKTPLYWASKHGNSTLTQMLLDAGAAVNAVCQEGHSPLISVVQSDFSWADRQVLKDSVRTVDLLISRGADVNWRDRQGLTPLHWAWQAAPEIGQLMVGRLLRHGADPNACDLDGRTPLLTVCQEENNEWHVDRDFPAANRVYLLLQGGAEPEVTGEDGLTPFVATAMRDDRDLTLEELFHHQMDILPDYD